jgi:hypothetical protein
VKDGFVPVVHLRTASPVLGNATNLVSTLTAPAHRPPKA